MIIITKITEIAIAVSGDFIVKQKEAERTENYQDLAIKINRVCNINTRALPVVVDALGVQHRLNHCLTCKDGAALALQKFDGLSQGLLRSLRWTGPCVHNHALIRPSPRGDMSADKVLKKTLVQK